jgi:hypothetical protein
VGGWSYTNPVGIIDRPSFLTRVIVHGSGVEGSGSETAIHSSLIVSLFLQSNMNEDDKSRVNDDGLM